MTRKTLIVGIFSIVYAVFALGILGFTFYQIVGEGKALTERIEAIGSKNAQTKMYADLAALVKSTTVERLNLSNYVLTEEGTSAFLTNVEALGTSQGVTLTTNSLKVDTKAGSFDELAIEFEISGTESAVKNMIVLLEKLPYHSSLTDLTLTRETNGRTKSTIGLVVTLAKHE